jgi:uncharacterized protein (DUF1501 family)
MISGGLQTKVYILNINGFDTHNAQVVTGNNTLGAHADLLKTLSDAVAAFQDDLQLLGLENRVAGMTFSEFGRQIASNASNGTDHGDAAPLFLFGSCINAGIIGPNPVIGNQIINQEGVAMQIDFRNVYASILKDWFEVPTTEIQSLFEHTVTYYQVLSACNVGLDEEQMEENAAIVFPNPAVSKSTVRFTAQNEWVKISVFDINGQEVATIVDRDLSQGVHTIPFEISDYRIGEYFVSIRKKSGDQTVKLVKVR